MIRYITLCISMIVLLSMLPANAKGLEKVRVVLVPFDVYSRLDVSEYEQRIPFVIGEHLKKEGADTVHLNKKFTPEEKNRERMRQLGMENGADFVVWGSMTLISDKFSLDTRLVGSFGEGKPTQFFIEGEGLENLPVVVKKLSDSLSMRIFRKEKVARVQVKGNRRIEADAIKRVIQTAAGDIFLAKSISNDLKAVYAMGYFDDIRVYAEESPNGKIIIFEVEEKPTIRNIRFTGNRVFDDEELQETLTISTGSILNIFDIKSNIQRIQTMYKDKNYHNVRIDYEIHELESNQAELEFQIDEGDKVMIREINFVGNRVFSEEELEDLMKTSEKGFFSWLTSSGDLNMDDLNQDIAAISSYYLNNGFIQVRVSDPRIEFKKDQIHITIKIDEGPRFQVGKVKVEGNIIFSRSLLLEKIKLKQEKFYNREIVRNDVMSIKDFYSDHGYAYAEVSPKINQDLENKIVDTVYYIDSGEKVIIERITIKGNTKTRDKVIRRELKLVEQQAFSGSDLKRGIRNLHRLDFFEDIKVNTQRVSDDKMNLEIEVTEKPTGTFSFGGGYSSVEKLFIMGSITERNVFGRAQILQLRAELGSVSNRFSVSFTEPWLFDIPLSSTIRLYNWNRDYDTYDKDSKGAGLRFGYLIMDYTRMYLSYDYDIGDIRNITDDASSTIKELEGTNIKSSISTALSYDSRDRTFNPTEGADHSISLEYAGVGGDIGFTKLQAELGQYIPLFWDTVGFLHAKSGYVRENSGGILPDYDRFYLGGINSMRGFPWRGIHATDEDGAEIGGDKYIQVNVEYLIPLIKQANVMGVLFFDTGNVYDNHEPYDVGELRQSAGFGFRWYSPMGPIRIENGYILDPKEGESRSGRWEFTMGAAF